MQFQRGQRQGSKSLQICPHHAADMASTLDQNLDLQMQSLRKAGCKKIFREKIFSGAKSLSIRFGSKDSRNPISIRLDFLSPKILVVHAKSLPLLVLFACAHL